MSLKNGKVAIDGSRYAVEEAAPIAATPKGIGVEESEPSTARQETNRMMTNKRAVMAICLLLLLIVGIVVVIVVLVVVFNDDTDDETTATAKYQCSASNAAAPTLDDGYRTFCDKDNIFCWNQGGLDIMGKSKEDRLDVPVSLSEDGSRFAATFWQGTTQGWQTEYPFIRVYNINDADEGGSQFCLVGQEINATTASAELGYWAEGHLSRNGKRLAVAKGPEAHESGLHPVTMYELSADAREWVSLPTGDVLLLGKENNPRISMSHDGSIVALASTVFQYGEAGWAFGPESIECHVETFRYNGNAIGWEHLGRALTFPQSQDYGRCKCELSSDGSTLGIMTDQVNIFHFLNGDWTGGHVPTQIDQFEGEERFIFLFSLASTGKHFAAFAQSTGTGDFRRSNDIFLYSYDENQNLWSQVNTESVTAYEDDADFSNSNFDHVFSILLSDSGNRVVEDKIVVRTDVLHHELRIYDMVQKTWSQFGGTIISEKYDSNDMTGLSVDLSGDGRRLLVGQYGRNAGVTARIQMYECTEHGVRCDKA